MNDEQQSTINPFIYAQIAIDVPLRTLFTYKIPAHLLGQIQIGSRVIVPFGNKKLIGFCLGLEKNSPTQKSLKEIKNLLSEPDQKNLLDTNYLNWLKFASDYYLAPIGQVLAQAIPPYYFDLKKNENQKELRSKDIPMDADFKTKSVTLTKKQTEIFQAILKQENSYFPALIHGITGSGKTEIYIKLIHEFLKHNKSSLFLVPEIGLTPQMLARLNHHFSGKLLVYHSGLTQNQRLNQWNHCLEDEAKVLVGTRSALFAPFKNLGLIIIDEEHDNSYKQEDRFRYNARDLALSRAKSLNIPILMGSATPSLETYYLAEEKRIHYFALNERIGLASLPEIRVVNFGKEKEQTGSQLLISQNIHQAIDHFYKERKQMILFVGQRGFAQNSYCLSCHTIQTCPNCHVGLKYHKHNNVLKCHYCDYEILFDEICKSCDKKSLTLLGYGTQSIEEEIQAMHPKLLLERIDSDTITSPKKLGSIFSDFANQKINMLIGTQMITKGHDFKNVGFVGILGVDSHLGLPDFRASERCFQNLIQVAGRAGRSDEKGHVIVQSLMPEHSAIQLGIAQDYKNFAKQELNERKALLYPPYCRLVQIRFLSAHQDRLKDFVKTWEIFLNQIRQKTQNEDLQILGPSEMPISKIRGKFRFHVIFKIRRGLKIQDIMEYVLQDLENRKLSGIQYQIDVDATGLY